MGIGIVFPIFYMYIIITTPTNDMFFIHQLPLPLTACLFFDLYLPQLFNEKKMA